MMMMMMMWNYTFFFSYKQVIHLTSLEDYAVVGYFVPRFQTGAVPAVPSELVLALVDCDLNSLDRWSRHVRVPHANLQLAPRQTRQRQTNRVGIQDGLDVGEFQTQDFIGVYPARSTHKFHYLRGKQGHKSSRHSCFCLTHVQTVALSLN